MAESSWPLPAASRVVTDVQFEQMMAAAVGSGWAGSPTDSPGIVVGTGAGRQVVVQTNKRAMVRGHGYNTGPTTANLAIAANASGQPRIDRVVLRVDRSTWAAALAVKTGTPGATPSAPTLQQDPDTTGAGAGLWEIPVAKVAVANGATVINAGDVTQDALFLAPAVLLCTSLTRPDSGTVIAGQEIHETDTGRRLVWTGTVWSNAAYGNNVKTFNSRGGCSASVNTTGAYADVTGASNSFTKAGAATDSNVEVEVMASVFTSVASTTALFGIRLGGTDYGVVQMLVNAAGQHTTLAGKVTLTGVGPGALAPQLRLQRVGAGGTLSVDSGDTVSFSIKEVPI